MNLKQNFNKQYKHKKKTEGKIELSKQQNIKLSNHHQQQHKNISDTKQQKIYLNIYLNETATKQIQKNKTKQMKAPLKSFKSFANKKHCNF